MSCRNVKALVYWTKERKVGIEPLTSVPSKARFVGAITPVKFSGDKKWYPGKVILISDDDDALDQKAREMASKIAEDNEKEDNAKNVCKPKMKRNVKKPSVGPGVATEKDVAAALGQRAPVPPELQTVKSAAAKLKKDTVKAHALAQRNLDSEVRNAIRKDLFKDTSSLSVTEKMPNQSAISEVMDVDESESASDDGASKRPQCSDDSDDEINSKIICCPTSQLIHKYSNPATTRFLRDLIFLFESKGDIEGKKCLTLLPIPDKVKKVELFPNKEVYIAASDKESLKVDFKNKPSSLIRETLYCLYGKKAFQTHTVTARGNKPGSYGIPNNVLRALHEFVNRNVDQSKQLKFSAMVASINKRAPEWRGRTTPSPSEMKKRKKTPFSKVISTSPFKCSPLKAPAGEDSDEGDDAEQQRQTVSTTAVSSPRKKTALLSESRTPSKGAAVSPTSKSPRRPSGGELSTAFGQGPPNYNSYHPQGYNPPPQGYNQPPQGYNQNPQGYNQSWDAFQSVPWQQVAFPNYHNGNEHPEYTTLN